MYSSKQRYSNCSDFVSRISISSTSVGMIVYFFVITHCRYGDLKLASAIALQCNACAEKKLLFSVVAAFLHTLAMVTGWACLLLVHGHGYDKFIRRLSHWDSQELSLLLKLITVLRRQPKARSSSIKLINFHRLCLPNNHVSRYGVHVVQYMTLCTFNTHALNTSRDPP